MNNHAKSVSVENEVIRKLFSMLRIKILLLKSCCVMPFHYVLEYTLKNQPVFERLTCQPINRQDGFFEERYRTEGSSSIQ